MITQDRLKEIWYYNEETGVVTWLVQPNFNVFVGDTVGYVTDAGYIRTSVDGRLYYIHVLIWLYMTGEYPDDDIDHENRIKDDNRWINLRISDRSHNIHNKHANRNNKLGVKGVTKLLNKYIARIRFEGKLISLGSYSTLEEAAEVYRLKSIELYGQFSPFYVCDGDKLAI